MPSIIDLYYHYKCILASENCEKSCPECVIVMDAKNLETRSEAMKNLTTAQLVSILQYACQEMKKTPGAKPFIYRNPAETNGDFKSIVYPMDLITLEINVKTGKYESLEAFLADAQWIVHSSAVLNSVKLPLAAAKKVLEVCREEIQDIEACLECYVKAHENDNEQQTWFVEACRRPHILVWVKLKGYPFWPAKAMNIKDGLVDVSFFGTHDQAWVPKKDCYLYSEQYPGVPPKKNDGLAAALEELNVHVEKLKELHGPIIFQTRRKICIGPTLSLQHIKEMLPKYAPEDRPVSKIVTGEAPQSRKTAPRSIRMSSLKIVGKSAAIDESETGHTSKTKLGSKNFAILSKNADGKPRSTDENTDNPEDEQNSADQDGNHFFSGAEPAHHSEALFIAFPVRQLQRNGGLETGSNSSAAVVMPQDVVMPCKLEPAEGEWSRDVTTPTPEFLRSFGLEKSSEVAKSEKPINGSSQPGELAHPSQVFEKQEENQLDEGGDGYGNVTNEVPISVLAYQGIDRAQTFLKPDNKPNPQRRISKDQVPSSINNLVEKLRKTVESGTEQFVAEMAEIKDENERLKKQFEYYKQNQDIHVASVTRELRAAFMADKDQALSELRKELELEKNKAVEQTKKKTWCALCGCEADSFCCWDIAYCGSSCQAEHWPSHRNSCSQVRRVQDNKDVPPRCSKKTTSMSAIF